MLQVLRPNLKVLQHALQEPYYCRSGNARASTHILAHLVMEQNKSGIQVFVVINTKDDDRPGALRQFQKTVGEIIVPSALNFLWLENGNNK